MDDFSLEGFNEFIEKLQYDCICNASVGVGANICKIHGICANRNLPIFGGTNLYVSRCECDNIICKRVRDFIYSKNIEENNEQVSCSDGKCFGQDNDAAEKFLKAKNDMKNLADKLSQFHQLFSPNSKEKEIPTMKGDITDFYCKCTRRVFDNPNCKIHANGQTKDPQREYSKSLKSEIDKLQEERDMLNVGMGLGIIAIGLIGFLFLTGIL